MNDSFKVLLDDDEYIGVPAKEKNNVTVITIPWQDNEPIIKAKKC